MVDYYCSHSGDDANPGLSGSPKRTIQGLQAVLGTGDTGYIAADEDYVCETLATDVNTSVTVGHRWTASASIFTAGLVGKNIWLNGNAYRISNYVSGTQVDTTSGPGALSGLSIKVGDENPLGISYDNANGDVDDNIWQRLKGYLGTPTIIPGTGFSTSGYVLTFDPSAQNLVLDTIKIDITGALGGLYGQAGSPALRYITNCELANGAIGAYFATGGQDMPFFVDSSIHGQRAHSLAGSQGYGIRFLGGGEMHMVGCKVYDLAATITNSGIHGIKIEAGTGHVIEDSLFYDITATSVTQGVINGILVDAVGARIRNCTFDGLRADHASPQGRAVYYKDGTSAWNFAIYNNIISDCDEGIKSNRSSIPLADYNNIYNCTTDYVEDAIAGDHDLAVNPAYRDAANGDYYPLNPVLHRAGKLDIGGQAGYRGAYRPQEYRRRGPRKITQGVWV